jgi:WD40 repeat protein
VLAPIDGRGSTRILPAGGWQALSICYSPDGSKIATSSRENAVRIWSEDGTALSRLETQATPWAVVFSPDGRKVLVSTWLFNIEVWDVESGRREQTLEGHSATVWELQFKPDDPDTLASSSGDGTVKLWSVSTGRNLATFDVCGGEEAIVAAFNPDGLRMAVTCSCNEVRMLDLTWFDRRIAGNFDSQRSRMEDRAGRSDGHATRQGAKR